MASSPSQPAPHKDKTFRNYDTSSAVAYAQYRPGYPDKLIDIIVDKHVSTGGGLDLLLDIGCGPGTATRSVAPRFTHAVAADPGRSMIEVARQIPSATRSGEPVRFEVCEAEKLTSLLPVLLEESAKSESAPTTTTTTQGGGGGAHGEGSGSKQTQTECVDLITAATTAHWFNMPAFYREAAKILKPGGSIIMWCTRSGYCTADTPNAEKLTQLLEQLDDETLSEFEEPGNRLVRQLYEGLKLPWDEPDTDADLSKVFPQTEFQRLEFNKDGHVAPGQQFLITRKFTLDQIKMALGTVSPVTRWREAYKDKIASGEVEDCVEKLARQAKELLDELPEGRGRDWIESGSAVVVLVIKKAK